MHPLSPTLFFSDQNVLLSEIPFTWTRLSPNTPYDWNYTTTPQAGLAGRVIPYARGHMLGGSSSISEQHCRHTHLQRTDNGVDALVYQRGSLDDWNRFASFTGDSGFSWDNMQQYFINNEHFNQPVDGHDISGQYNPSIHGTNGLLYTTLPGYPNPLDGPVVNASNELGGIYKFKVDYNDGNMLGIGESVLVFYETIRRLLWNLKVGFSTLQEENLVVVLPLRI